MVLEILNMLNRPSKQNQFLVRHLGKKKGLLPFFKKPGRETLFLLLGLISNDRGLCDQSFELGVKLMMISNIL